ncbi:hypothetical protein J1N35_007694 [Gossypium stocksii]|uniref:Uncharacterized protein n=1 Tax=Gossypium stocksii TaxID=47602 RepID=A0A9D4AFX0_9ROSI|nr:hypothetical protein J1N35_007694 [Gossypium stocksii]
MGKKWRDHKSTLKKEYFKKDISLKQKLRNVPPGMLRTVSELEQAVELLPGQKVGRLQLFDIMYRKKDGSPITSEAEEIMKLKDKKEEYEAITSSDSSVNLVDVDNRIIAEVLGPESSQQYMPSGSQAQAEVQRLRDQIAHIVEAVAREAKAAPKEAEQSRKYDELYLQLQNMMKMFQQSQNLPS